MLQWFSSGVAATTMTTSEATQHDDDDDDDDAPETPAPLFAVRAFKQALWGTPRLPPPPPNLPSNLNPNPNPPSNLNAQVVSSQSQSQFQSQSQSHSQSQLHTTHAEPRPDFLRRATGFLASTTTTFTATMAGGDGGRGRGGASADADAGNAALGTSPRKAGGILMTPGTTAAANARRKTVTFPAGVKGSGGGGGGGGSGGVGSKAGSCAGVVVELDAETLFNPRGAGLAQTTPRDLPGGFPGSPGPGLGLMSGDGGDATATKRQGQDQRASSRRRVLDNNADGENDDMGAGQDVTIDLTSPRSRSGRYWKAEYESYSGTSVAQMRRLAKREVLAKKFARVKDAEAVALREELRVQRTRVGVLERRGGGVDVGGEVCGVVDVESPKDLRERTERAEGSVGVLNREKRALAMEVESIRGERDELREECERLRRENEKLRSGSVDRASLRKGTKRAPRASRKPRESFDIWADVAGLEDEEEEESLPVLDASSPLKAREVNEVAKSQPERMEVAERLDKATSTKAPEAKTEMSAKEERLAAAKLRLEERRRNREKNSG